MKNGILRVAAAIAAFGLYAPAFAQDIDTTGSATESIGDFGTPQTATYGQTFTVGTTNALDSFTLYLNGSSGDSLSFRAYVYAWSGTRAIGNAIYTSDEQHFSALGDTIAFTFATGDVGLVSGQQYVAFLTTSGVANPEHVAATMPFSGVFNDVYSGGDLVYTNSFDNFASITSQDWEYSGSGSVFGDAAFKAHFVAGNPVPEPAAWGMMIGGFALAGGVLRARLARRGARFAGQHPVSGR